MDEFKFGRYPKNIVPKQWWGARGIFKPNDKYCKLDIPYDRQSYEGDKHNSDDFMFWINYGFMEKLEKRYGELSSDQNKVIRIESDGGRFVGEVSCQNSSGYLYIGCWE